ncbi:hypothetical protein RJ640_030933 [Escallonia rubra]|uniref:Pentatricopeptide repeat-containing protein n=1 Tax=Escallonia rubra TaxID=112253 RepID=A0AA88UBR1_9ASTE|nr:hypothetical protein RJ640_030933 [Escallonia rubra]
MSCGFNGLGLMSVMKRQKQQVDKSSSFEQVHAKFIKTGRIRDPLSAAELLRFFGLYHRNLRYACHIFDQMDPPNCRSWNTIIRALSESDDQNDDDPFQALVLFRLMLVDELVEPNRFTFPSVLKACAQTGRVEEGKQVHGMVVKIGLEDDEFVLSNLVRMYVMCGAMEYAHVLFNSNKVNVERKTQMGGTVLWNVMVDGFVRKRISDWQGNGLMKCRREVC